MSILQRYVDWSAGVEERLLTFMDPSLQWKRHPMKDAPLANFASVYAICIAYLSFVIIGTAVMKARVPAIKTSAVQFFYNPLQVLVCSYMCLEAVIQAYRNGYSPLPCNNFNADKPVMGNVLYFFYLSKMLDLCDTVFIIVGKKWKQLSVLHVYHHLTVVFIYYLVFRLGYDADSFQSVVLNGFIHTIMYMYYFVSAHTRDIWWKKYLTAMQLTQFALMNVQGYFSYKRQCAGMPWSIPALYLVYVQSLFWLFVNFYVRSYVLPRRKAKAAAAAEKAKKSL